MKSILRTSVVLIALLVIIPLSATAQQYKIDKPIFGFYLGESKQSLFQRAKGQGIAYSKGSGKIGELFSDGYIFNGSLNESKLVEYALISFSHDYVAQIGIYFKKDSQNPQNQFEQAAKVLGKSWNATPVYSTEAGFPMYTVMLPEAVISIMRPNGADSQTVIAYIHVGLWNRAKEEENKTLAGDQF